MSLRFWVFMIAVGVVVAMFAAPAVAGDDQHWACQVLLCMSNPGGAEEFAECHEPMHKLENHLYNGHKFPVCNMSEDKDGGDKPGPKVEVDEGRQDYITCEEAYGPEYKPYNPPNEDFNFNITVNIDPSKMKSVLYPDGHAYNQDTQCRKQIGTQMMPVCDENFVCLNQEVPQYIVKGAVRNKKANFVQVSINGQPGDRFYYKKKKKKKDDGGLF